MWEERGDTGLAMQGWTELLPALMALEWVGAARGGDLVLGHLNTQGSKPVCMGFRTNQYLPLLYPKLELPFGLFDSTVISQYWFS